MPWATVRVEDRDSRKNAMARRSLAAAAAGGGGGQYFDADDDDDQGAWRCCRSVLYCWECSGVGVLMPGRPRCLGGSPTPHPFSRPAHPSTPLALEHPRFAVLAPSFLLRFFFQLVSRFLSAEYTGSGFWLNGFNPPPLCSFSPLPTPPLRDPPLKFVYI